MPGRNPRAPLRTQHGRSSNGSSQSRRPTRQCHLVCSRRKESKCAAETCMCPHGSIPRNSQKMPDPRCPPAEEQAQVPPHDQTVVRPPEPSADTSCTAQPGGTVRFPTAPFTSSILETAGPGPPRARGGAGWEHREGEGPQVEVSPWGKESDPPRHRGGGRTVPWAHRTPPTRTPETGVGVATKLGKGPEVPCPLQAHRSPQICASPPA